jgi:hypothetical protein
MSLVFRDSLTGKLTDQFGSSGMSASSLYLDDVGLTWNTQLSPPNDLALTSLRSGVSLTADRISQYTIPGRVAPVIFESYYDISGRSPYTTALGGVSVYTEVSNPSAAALLTQAVSSLRVQCKQTGTWGSDGSTPSGILTASFTADAWGDMNPAAPLGRVAVLTLQYTDSSGGGTINDQTSLIILNPVNGSKSITSQTGINVFPNSGAGVNRKVGIRVGAQSAGVTNYGLWFSSDNANVGSGIAFGVSADTTMYRLSSNQLVTPGYWNARRYLCTSVPTIVAGAGAGTSPVISLTGSDAGFTVTLVQGNPSATGVIFTATLGTGSSGGTARVGISPGNANAAALTGTASVYITKTSTAVVLNSGSSALTAGTTYVWDFVCNFS